MTVEAAIGSHFSHLTGGLISFEDKTSTIWTHLTSETLQPRALPCWPSQFNCKDPKSSSKVISFLYLVAECEYLSDGLHKFKGRQPMYHITPVRSGLLLKLSFLL